MNIYLRELDRKKIAELKRKLEKEYPHKVISISEVIRYALGYTTAHKRR